MFYSKHTKSSFYYILALLWPFLSLIYTFRNIKSPWAKNVFWIVCIFMGFIQIYQPEGTILGVGADSGRYVIKMQDMYYNVNSFSELSSKFYNGSTLDIYFTSLAYLISRFTTNGHVLYLVVALVFGFFYSRNVWYVIDRLPNKVSVTTLVLIGLLFLVCPIWSINGIRMWTALHMFVYGAMPFFIEGKKNKIWICIISLFVHHSFLFPIVLLLLYIFIPQRFLYKKNTLLYVFIFYLFSLTVNQLNLESVNSILQNYLPNYYEDRIDSYVSENALISHNESVSQHAWQTDFLPWLNDMVIQVFIFISFFTIKNNKRLYKGVLSLFIFSLLFYGISNIASNIPGGGRYIVLAKMLIVPIFIYVITYFPLDKFSKSILPILSFLLAVSLLFNLRVGFDYYGIMLLVGNFFSAPFVTSDIPLIDFIKQMLS